MMWSVPVFRTKYLKPFQQNQHRITRISNITKNPKNNKLLVIKKSTQITKRSTLLMKSNLVLVRISLERNSKQFLKCIHFLCFTCTMLSKLLMEIENR